MRSRRVSKSNVALCRLASIVFCLVIVKSVIASALGCPISIDPGRAVWVELNSVPSNTPMDLVSFYDRTSGMQFLAWVGLLVFALAGIALIIERSIKYSYASRQTHLFISLASGALVYDRPAEALRLASRFPASPVAFLVSASLTPDERGEFQFSTSARQIAATAMTSEIARGLATLGAIAMTAPIIGATAAIEGLIRFLRESSRLPISSDVLQNLVADWLLGLLAALALALVATWGHRLLRAKANRLMLEMDQLSLATITRIIETAERPSGRKRVLALSTSNIGSQISSLDGN